MSIKKWHRDTLGNKVVQALKKNEFDALYCTTGKEAVAQVLKYITPGAIVGVGGSVTIGELGILEKAEALGAKVLNHNKPGFTGRKTDTRRRQLLSDFLCSSNAITLTGT